MLAHQLNRSLIVPNLIGDPKIYGKAVGLYRGQALWPGFRVIFVKKHANIPIELLEPGQSSFPKELCICSY